MKNIKSYLFAILFSVLGGLTSITGYKYFNPETDINISNNKNIKLANYVYDTTDVIVPEGLNFIYTSKKTTPAVVHIRTTFESRSTTTRNPFEDMFRDFLERGMITEREKYQEGEVQDRE